jgi:hypothetical protein
MLKPYSYKYSKIINSIQLSDPDININLTDFDLEMKMFCVGTVFKVSVGVKVTSSPSHKYSFPLSSISIFSN